MQFTAGGFKGAFDKIHLADGNSTGSQHRVAFAQGSLQSRANCLRRVGHQWKDFGDATDAFKQCRQAEAVAFVNLARTELLAGFAQFRTGGQQTDDGLPPHPDFRPPRRGQQANVTHRQKLASFGERRPPLYVFAPGTDILSRFGRVQDKYLLGLLGLSSCVLLHHDSVGASRQRRAREQSHTSPGRNPVAERFSGGDSSAQSQAHWLSRIGGSHVLRLNGVTIHGGIVKRRQVDRRSHPLGQYAPARAVERYNLGRRRWDGRQDSRQGLFKLEHEAKVLSF